MAENKNNPYGYLFGDSAATQAAQAEVGNRYQTWLNTRRDALERKRTSDVNMARYNALGNLITTMVKPVGWAAGGGGFDGATAGTDKYDNRQYLDSFNSAVKAADDIRNVGSKEAEYQFQLAEDEYKRRQALDKEARTFAEKQMEAEERNRAKQEQKEQEYKLKAELEAQKIEGRIRAINERAQVNYRFKTRGGGSAPKSKVDKILQTAQTEYIKLVQDYYKKLQIGLENLQEPPSYEKFLEDCALKEGVTISTASTGTGTGSTRNNGGTESAGLVQRTESAGLVNNR